jgi:hypothetical protein
MFWKGIFVSSLYKLPRDSIRSKQEEEPGLTGKVQLLPPFPESITSSYLEPPTIAVVAYSHPILTMSGSSTKLPPTMEENISTLTAQVEKLATTYANLTTVQGNQSQLIVAINRLQSD